MSQLSPIDQKESFYTVYSESHGLDLSGIEIVATAFANMLEDMPVQPVNFRVISCNHFFLGNSTRHYLQTAFNYCLILQHLRAHYMYI